MPEESLPAHVRSREGRPRHIAYVLRYLRITKGVAFRGNKIVSEQWQGDPRWFRVKLSLAKGEQTAKYAVMGKNPVWVQSELYWTNGLRTGQAATVPEVPEAAARAGGR